MRRKNEELNTMAEMILNTSILPEPLIGLIHAPQIKVEETDGKVILIPVKKEEYVDWIEKARGVYTDGKLSVDKFLADKRTEEIDR
jgi:hypothetical protein